MRRNRPAYKLLRCVASSPRSLHADRLNRLNAAPRSKQKLPSSLKSVEGAREEAQAWQEELNARQAEEESRKAHGCREEKGRRKEAGEILSGDEEGGEKREKKRRKKSTKQSRKIRSKSEIETDEEDRAMLEDDREASLTPDGDDDVNGGGADGEGDEGGEKEDEAVAKARRAKSQLVKLKAKVSPAFLRWSTLLMTM